MKNPAAPCSASVVCHVIADGEDRAKVRKAPYPDDPIRCVGFGRVVTLTAKEWEEVQKYQWLDAEMQKRFRNLSWPNAESIQPETKP